MAKWQSQDDVDRFWRDVLQYLQESTSEQLSDCKNDQRAAKARLTGDEASLQSFRCGDISTALRLYGDAVRLAAGSVERACAHANRSECHLARQQYSSCSSEAQTALRLLENGSAEDSSLNQLRQKLQTRLRKCESIVNQHNNGKINQPSKRQQLHLGVNSILKSMSAAVQMRTVNASGRGLYAKESIPAGSVISRECAFASATRAEVGVDVCSHCCSLLTGTFYPCNDCVTQVYCSEQCNQLASHVYHKSNCLNCNATNSLTSQNVKYGPNLVSIMSLCASRRQHERSVYAQEASECLLRHTLNEKWWQHSDWQVTLSVNERVRLVASLMLKILDRLICNQYGICALIEREGPYEHVRRTQKDIGAVAVGLYISQSLLNHSCVPNVEIFYNGSVAEVRSITNIIADEQICVSYGPRCIDAERTTRQQFLSGYDFHCQCEACAGSLRELDTKMHWLMKCPECNKATVVLENDKCGNCHKSFAVDSIIEQCTLIDDLLANASVDALAQLAHIDTLSKLLCDDSILLIRNKMSAGFRLVTATDAKVRKQALKLLEDALIAYEHYASYFPLDYERCLSQILYGTVKAFNAGEAQKKIIIDKWRQRAAKFYTLCVTLYGSQAHDMLLMRFGDNTLLETAAAVHEQQK